MKPPRFEYHAPRALDEALALLARQGDRAKVLAGGQSLIPLLNFRLAHPEVLVDINRIGDLAYVRANGDGLAIGALTRQHAVERSETVRARAPILAEACRFIGHLPIRHRGTIGGSLAHADPASELPAVMVALEAQLTLAREQARRTMSAAGFFVGPLTTALAPGELLVEVRVPDPPRRTGGAFVEMARRAGDFALVGVAALITLDASGRCERARIALCGVGPTPIRARAAEDAVLGGTEAGAAFDEAASRAAATSPPADVHGSAARSWPAFTREASLAAERATGADHADDRAVASPSTVSPRLTSSRAGSGRRTATRWPTAAHRLRARRCDRPCCSTHRRPA
jgi:CO/xanthine dehydrogenase FAD-binding subunit